MKNQLFQFPQDILKQIKCVRKINPNDKFPCFACFDQFQEKRKCKVCAGTGYVMGSHPMVQFSQDFIDKKIAYLRKQQQQKQQNSGISNNNSSNGNHFDQRASIQHSISPTITPVPTPNYTNTSLTNSNFLDSGSQSQEDETIVHQGYHCDLCNIEPIKGYRYHCQICKDFDLCPKCYHKTFHQHDFCIFKQPEKQQKQLRSSNGGLKSSTAALNDRLKNLRKSLRKME